MSDMIDPALVWGAAELEPTARGLRVHRLPAWVREQCPDPQLLSMQTQPAGVRLVARTTAVALEVTVHTARIAYLGASRPRGRLDILVDGDLFQREVLTGGDVTEVDLRAGTTSFAAGAPHTASVAALPAGEKVVEIWLPHNESVEVVSLHADAPLRPDHDGRPIWVHHGSSISQGSGALAPTETWAALAAHSAGLDLRNLGFGGSALVDQFMARVIRDSPADLISVKLGINVVNGDMMRLRAFTSAVHGFLDTIRDGHPSTPIVLISPIFCDIHETTPGPGAFDMTTLGTDQVRFVATGDPADAARGKPTLRSIRAELASLTERRGADPHLHYLDGTTLFGPADAEELPLPDALHPNALAHRRIGERFATYLAENAVPLGLRAIHSSGVR
ncbi:GDSL-type esterase/lipase family protein [Nocardia takedensis]